jgi:hypothetical protein
LDLVNVLKTFDEGLRNAARRGIFGLLTNRFFILGVLIYLVPGLTIYGYGLSQSIKPGGNYAMDMWFFLFLIFSICFILAIPALMLIFQPFYMIPYFIIAYGFLYLYWRRCSKKGAKQQKKPPNKEDDEAHTKYEYKLASS